MEMLFAVVFIGVVGYFGFMNGLNRERERMNRKANERNSKIGTSETESDSGDRDLIRVVDIRVRTFLEVIS